jgi:hypothetical protein
VRDRSRAHDAVQALPHAPRNAAHDVDPLGVGPLLSLSRDPALAPSPERIWHARITRGADSRDERKSAEHAQAPALRKCGERVGRAEDRVRGCTERAVGVRRVQEEARELQAKLERRRIRMEKEGTDRDGQLRESRQALADVVESHRLRRRDNHRACRQMYIGQHSHR